MNWFGSLKKIFLLIAGTAIVATAQNKYCGTTEFQNKLISEHPEILQKQQELEQFTQEYIKSSKKTEAQVYIIPIVFHILHNYGYENISDEQVIDAVRILNEDFRKLNSDITEVVPAFQGIAADCEIEFRLASKDPNGNCTNGIERIVTPLTYDADDDSKLNQWPRAKYLNIWVVRSFLTAGIAGYSYYPASTGWNPSIDGIMVSGMYVGSIGTGSEGNSRVLTHEVGHYLNLPHPWGSNNSPGEFCGDDNVDDTPETMGWKTCNLSNSAVCNLNIQENIQNYMEYAYCNNMFTQGQKDRMRAALISGVAQRNNLWAASNLAATGTDILTPSVCAPQVDFNPNQTLVCSGSQIKFTDLSWNGYPSTWLWLFAGGTPDTSTLSNPTIQYNTPGTYNVTLVAGNSGGTGTKIKTEIVTVYPNTAAYTGLYFDSFESGTFPNNDWKVGNSDGGVTWQQSNIASNGNFSVMINNSSENQGQMDEMISPSIDLSSMSDPILYFKVANAKRHSESTDGLEVYISTNCGESWTLQYVKTGTNLATAGIVAGNFIPSASQWRVEAVNISFYASKPSVFFKFKFTGGDGNNIYIDDVDVSGGLGIKESSSVLNFSVFPNPADESAVVNFYLIKSQVVSLKIYDLPGKEIDALLTNEQLQPREHSYTVQRSKTITPGMYLIRLKTENGEFYEKITFR